MKATKVLLMALALCVQADSTEEEEQEQNMTYNQGKKVISAIKKSDRRMLDISDLP